MGERECNELIGRAFVDKALLKRLATARNLNGVKTVAASINIRLTDADASTLLAKLKNPNPTDPEANTKLDRLTFVDVIEAIEKAKSKNEQPTTGRSPA
jgi:hypothetical protein